MTPGPVRATSNQAAPTRGRAAGSVLRGGQTRTATNARSDAGYLTQTSTTGLSNTRTRIVGERTGVTADAVIGLVRFTRAARAGFARFARRLAEVVTPLGWVLGIAVPFLLVIGYVTGVSELVVAGYAGLVLVIVASIYLLGRGSFVIELAVPHSRVVVGQPASGELVVTNPTSRRLFGTEVEVPVGRGLAVVALASVARGSTQRHTFSIPTERRGVLVVGPARTVRADPVGLVRRELVWTDETSIFVHPKTVSIPSSSTGFIRDLEGKPTTDLSNNDVAFHALREYRPGDDRRYIHWKTTAKTGTYMVRQFEETRRSHVVVALSVAIADYQSPEEFELAVSVAGSLGVRAIRDARDVAVVIGETTPEFAKRKVLAVVPLNTLTPTRLLDDLSLVEQATFALGLDDVARVTADTVGGISVAYLVCGASVAPATLRSASAHFPPGVEVVAVVCDPDTVPGLRRLAGLSVLTIGYLADLQKSLARAAAV